MNGAKNATGKASSKHGLRAIVAVAVKAGFVAAAAIGASFVVTGCSHVAPYERGTLAHPTMSPEDMGSGVDEHVRAVSEGATGGFGGGGGGCGCN